LKADEVSTKTREVPGISLKSKGIKKSTDKTKKKQVEDDFEEGEVVELPELYPVVIEANLGVLQF
jgi:hypothetical protein